MKRREKPRAGADGVIPLEFLVGRALEVWADPPNNPLSVMSRYSKAWEEYLHLNGVDRKEGMRRRPASGGIYSVDYLISTGRRVEVEERLARVGVRVTDLPDLRARAVEWVATYRARSERKVLR